MSSVKIGSLFGADVIVCNYVPHDNIWISPKEEKLFLKLIELESRLSEFKDLQGKLAEPIILVKGTLNEENKP